MGILEDVVLEHSIEIRTTPGKIFEFFHQLHLDDNYLKWHPDDNVLIRWVK